MNLYLASLVLLSMFSRTSARLEVVYEWVYLDYTWLTPEDRQEAIDNGTYIIENNAMAGVKVYNDDVYVTVPRWTPGVPSTLNKVVTVDDQTLLQPYPSWEMQEIENCEAFQYVQSMEIDPNTGYMWVIDIGRINVFEWPPDNVSINACPAKLVIIDLSTDQIIHRHEFPADVLTPDGNFVNDIVIDPDGGYAYMSDVGNGPEPDFHLGGIVVYDMNTQTSHRLEHESMLPEPEAINFEIGNRTYLFNVPVDGMALSPDKTQLHYSALGGYRLYQLPTSVARDPDANLTAHVRDLGRKASQSDGLLMGYQRLYYGCLAGVFQSSLCYWDYRAEMDRTGLPLDEITMKYYAIYYRNDTTMVWPDTFAMDDQGYLWVVSNKLNEFSSGEMDFSGAAGPNFMVSRFLWADDRSYLYNNGSGLTESNGIANHCNIVMPIMLLVFQFLGNSFKVGA